MCLLSHFPNSHSQAPITCSAQTPYHKGPSGGEKFKLCCLTGKQQVGPVGQGPEGRVIQFGCVHVCAHVQPCTCVCVFVFTCECVGGICSVHGCGELIGRSPIPHNPQTPWVGGLGALGFSLGPGHGWHCSQSGDKQQGQSAQGMKGVSSTGGWRP